MRDYVIFSGHFSTQVIWMVLTVCWIVAVFISCIVATYSYYTNTTLYTICTICMCGCAQYDVATALAQYSLVYVPTIPTIPSYFGLFGLLFLSITSICLCARYGLKILFKSMLYFSSTSNYVTTKSSSTCLCYNNLSDGLNA